MARARRLFGAFAAGLGIALVAATSAKAVIPSDCSNAEFCIYENVSSPYFFSGYLPANWTRNQCTATPNNRESYIYNRTQYRWFLFRDTGCAGAHLEVPPQWYGNITYLGSTWDNKVIRVMRTSSLS